LSSVLTSQCSNAVENYCKGVAASDMTKCLIDKKQKIQNKTCKKYISSIDTAVGETLNANPTLNRLCESDINDNCEGIKDNSGIYKVRTILFLLICFVVSV